MKTWAVIGSIMGWFALIAQFYLIQVNRVESATETTIRYFSYFTILTNLLVACMFTAKLMPANHRLRNWFEKPSVFAAVTLYIMVVGLVYQVILRHVWEPTGFQQLVDELLHTVIPLYALIYWIRFSIRHTIRFGSIPSWLLYPLAYVCYVLARGSVSGFYPYPFLHVDNLGWKSVVLNAIAMFGLFFILSIILVIYNRRK